MQRFQYSFNFVFKTKNATQIINYAVYIYCVAEIVSGLQSTNVVLVVTGRSGTASVRYERDSHGVALDVLALHSQNCNL